MTVTLDRADARLRDRVVLQLAHTRDLDAIEMGVWAVGGRVTIMGSVGTFPEMVAAAGAVKRLYGVRGIINEIEVRDEDAVTDTEIEEMARTALLMRAGVPPPVTARVTDGCVVLEGTVSWMYQRLAAEAAVTYLPGVRGVENRIALAAYDGVGRLQEEIEQALMRTAGLDWKRIRVDASKGRVRLSGAVFSLIEKEEAEHAAWANPAVRGVDNDLDVVARRWW